MVMYNNNNDSNNNNSDNNNTYSQLRHKPKDTDFLVIRSGNKTYLREIPGIRCYIVSWLWLALEEYHWDGLLLCSTVVLSLLLIMCLQPRNININININSTPFDLIRLDNIAVYLIGQLQPKLEVPAPNSRATTTYMKNRLQVTCT